MPTPQPSVRVFTLLSGGIDSSTTLAIAKRIDFPPDSKATFEAVTINYGQRHIKEAEAAKMITQWAGVQHTIINTEGLLQGMLVEKGEQNEKIPDVSYADLPHGISPTYVSFRNGFMLSILAARAQAWVMAEEEKQKANRKPWTGSSYPPKFDPIPGAEAYIYIGVHADDGVNWAYPDCTPEFIGPMAAAIFIGTYNKVRLRTPIIYHQKHVVVATGLQLGVPFEYTWSCYKGEEKHCGICPTCRSRRDAFTLIGRQDPTEYAADPV
jgi:7-cyano-7-deazaguanine synthase